NPLYSSLWLGGGIIPEIDDMANPKWVSRLGWSPPFACPTHTALPVPFPINGRRYMVVADEDVVRAEGDVAAFMWTIDITDERHPAVMGSFQVEGIEGRPQPTMTACHQPCEKVAGTEIPFAWFAHGLRIIDVKNPHPPPHVAHF